MESALSIAPAPVSVPVFRVGNVPVYGDAILAPMDGFSDWPFRSLCSALGSAMSYTEFVRAEAITHAFEQMHLKESRHLHRPHIRQVAFGEHRCR
jgi:tRNA-dihydrouridine synthase